MNRVPAIKYSFKSRMLKTYFPETEAVYKGESFYFSVKKLFYLLPRSVFFNQGCFTGVFHKEIDQQ